MFDYLCVPLDVADATPSDWPKKKLTDSNTSGTFTPKERASFSIQTFVSDVFKPKKEQKVRLVKHYILHFTCMSPMIYSHNITHYRENVLLFLKIHKQIWPDIFTFY